MVVLVIAVCGAVIVAALLAVMRLRHDVVHGAVRQTAPRSTPFVGDGLEAAAAGLRSPDSVDELVSEAGRALADLDGILEVRFELFPFDSKLPRLAQGKVQF